MMESYASNRLLRTLAKQDATTAINSRGITVRVWSWRLDAARQPADMPKNVARSTMLVKNVRLGTMLPNQRIQASSKNRTRKLIRNKSR